jgi:alpha-tubulin suppressor-like RCC1 family protein
MCWGANDAGQLGIGSGTGSKSTPERTSPNLAASFLGLGANHSCADDGSGVLFCWGANASFQIDDIGIDQRSPKSVVSDASGVAGGIGHTCAIRVGRVTCWGLNDKGQLGSGAPGHEPVEVSNLSSVSAIAASYKHTCAIDAGTVKCWGLNDRGQLGGPSLGDFSAAPVLVSGR